MDFATLCREAKLEVQRKPQAAIEKETAYKWAARAIACVQLQVEAMENHKQSAVETWKYRYYDNRHEALEHAAMVRDDGETLAQIEEWLDEANSQAAADIGG